MPSKITTRFAPSPTGYLHIGGARTALFNMLFARQTGGDYLLRIEDTDRKRSTPEAIKAITDGLEWLGLMPDKKPVYQSKNFEQHVAIARKLLAEGKAYHCYSTPEELQEKRKKARAEGRSIRYDGTWRHKTPSEAPSDVQPVIRLKAPTTGATVIMDCVQGEVKVDNSQLDDMIILRSDGTPTYMLSVVVDDHDMKISHVIRGDDHLTNAFRQTQLFNALGWQAPIYAHIPLIHGSDGTKMSKRHGALGIEKYREMGYLPEALINYLLRLGWSHGDDEIISIKQAVEWFKLENINKGAARFDFGKLSALNGNYLQTIDNDIVIQLIGKHSKIDKTFNLRLKKGLSSLKNRSNTILELCDNAHFYLCNRPVSIEADALKFLNSDALVYLEEIKTRLKFLSTWTEEEIKSEINHYIRAKNLKLVQLAQPLRAAICGTTVSPSIFEVLYALGKEEALGRISDVAR